MFKLSICLVTNVSLGLSHTDATLYPIEKRYSPDRRLVPISFHYHIVAGVEPCLEEDSLSSEREKKITVNYLNLLLIIEAE